MRDYEELVKRLREAPSDWPDAELHYDAADAIEDLIAALTASNEVIAKSGDKWISADERPTKNVCDDGYTGYLVFSDGYIKVADYTCGFYVEGEYDPNVTHYMPLPEPPKESTNDSR